MHCPQSPPTLPPRTKEWERFIRKAAAVTGTETGLHSACTHRRINERNRHIHSPQVACNVSPTFLPARASRDPHHLTPPPGRKTHTFPQPVPIMPQTHQERRTPPRLLSCQADVNRKPTGLLKPTFKAQRGLSLPCRHVGVFFFFSKHTLLSLFVSFLRHGPFNTTAAWIRLSVNN